MKKKIFTLLFAVVAGIGTMFASDTSVGGIWYNFNNGNLTAEVTYPGDNYDSYWNKYSGEVVIPASVTYNAQTYTVTSIGEHAFRYCTGLTSVTIPNSVTSIEYGAFVYCSGLTSVTIPNSVTSIGEGAFSDCGLTSVTIPNSVTSIGEYAFQNCTGLTSVTIGNSVTSIEYGAFCSCTGLTSVTIPNSVTSIGNQAFANCGLTSVTIPNSVTSIGMEAFQNCTGLTSVTIGNSVTSIGDGAFKYCDGLSSVTNYATTPQTINSNVFGGDDYYPGVNKSTCVLNVPNESVSLYQAADGWKEFTNIVGVDVPSSAPAVYTNPANPAQKLIKNGNVYILTDDKTYTLTGQEVK